MYDNNISETIMVMVSSLISNPGLYYLLIASIVSRSALTIVREVRLGEKDKRRVASLLKQNKDVLSSLVKVQVQVDELTLKTARSEKIINSYKLDQQFNGKL